MSLRSLFTTGLLAAGALAAPPGYGNTVTVTVTEKASCSASASPTSHSTSTSTSHSSSTSEGHGYTHSPWHYPSHSSSSTKTSTTSKASTSVSSASKTSATSTASPTSKSSATSSATSKASSVTSSVVSVTTTTSSLASTAATTTILATATATNYGLNDAAKAAGKLWFGTALDVPGTGEAQDPYYIAEFDNIHDFGEATPANIMKYEFTEPEAGVFNYTGAEEFFTAAAGKAVRCHNLIWANELPTFITNPTVNWTNATLTAALRRHVTTLVEHFGNRCYSWDVVNEAFSDSPAGAYAANIWYDTIGPAYVVEAFQAASDAVRANGLATKLYYNDYNIEFLGNKSYAAQALVKDLQNRNIQIDGVGLESHFIAGETPSKAAQQANMEAFTALGVDVVVTELDVRLNLPPTVATEAQQVVDYYNTVAACVAVPRCVGIVVWDFDDTYSWIPGTFPGQGYGDLFLQPNGANTPLVRKAPYDGCLEALTGAPEAL
ncbi:hypothetical protein LTR01_004011 [Friedmanniomyces endolithicus]|nr:hypothetical protein LTS09_001415 [Friedmanniomyces endolithicus]KAK0309814.1 hypothetical protein LTR01_004011 [Friedmanniomyces endolithicus]